MQRLGRFTPLINSDSNSVEENHRSFHRQVSDASAAVTPPAFHALSALKVLEHLSVDTKDGLSTQEADRRYSEFGPNILRAEKRRSDWAILVAQFKSLLTILLVVATVVSFAFGDFAEGVAILAVIVVNAAIGFLAERKAVTSIEALRHLGAAVTHVRRDGVVATVPAERLIPGDIVLLEAGDVVTADIRLVAVSGLECDESLLTGESAPVQKSVQPVAIDAQVAERACLAFKGTAVTRGSCEAVVVATGGASELGGIAKLVAEAKEEVTPLEQRLERLSRQLMWVVLGIAAVVLFIGVVSERDTVLMVKTGIALAIAAIPEGLPIVATLALARGMWRLARRNALVKRLSAVETLGAVTVIFADKTGTLTKNRMTVTELVLVDGAVRFLGDEVDRSDTSVESLRRAARVLDLCTSAALQDAAAGTGLGDPMEIALLHAASKLGIPTEVGPKVGEVAFDPETRMMAVIHKQNGGRTVSVKGAPEVVIARSALLAAEAGDRPMTEADKSWWNAKTMELASEGLRVLALADNQSLNVSDDPYEGLALIGLVALKDPPRDDARPAVEAARRAGVKVVMITGDNAVTGANIAYSVGITDAPEIAIVEGKNLGDPTASSGEEKARLLSTLVFARVSPKQKLSLIELYQEAGEIVAMTGDGVNDAPALKKADIGVAMGLRGTQVANEAADIILKDDAFASIIVAVYEGRVIFTNIRKFVIYLMSCNVSEVLVVATGIAAGLPLPLMPLQILFLNLVTDVFPALALGVGEGDREVLKRPPRDPKESIMAKRHWFVVGLYGVLLTTAVLCAFIWATRQPDRGVNFPVTVAFLTIALAQMWQVFNMRSRLSHPLNNQLTRNPYIWAALALCGALLLAAVYVPPLAAVLDLVPPDATAWGVIVGASVAPLLVGQLMKAIPANVVDGRAGARRRQQKV